MKESQLQAISPLKTGYLFLGLSFIIFKNKKKLIIPVSILFVFVEVLIFLSGERTAFFYNTLAALFIIIMINNFKKIRLITFLTSFFVPATPGGLAHFWKVVYLEMCDNLGTKMGEL